MKKSVIAFICLALLFAMPLASAGFWQWLTGKATQPTNVDIGVGNTAPTIPSVETISDVSPTSTTFKTVTFNFTAYDHDENTDLNDSTASATFTKDAVTRSDVLCSPGAASGKTKDYSCSIDMWYFDVPGVWSVSVTVKDNSDATATNSTTTFNYSPVTAFEISPPTLTWGTLSPGAIDQKSNNDPTIMNNTGNYESSAITINATDLKGLTLNTKIIYGSNFSSNTLDACGGTALSSSVFVNVTGAALARGNLSLGGGVGQEELFYCLNVPPSVTKQSYSTSEMGAWTIKVE